MCECKDKTSKPVSQRAIIKSLFDGGKVKQGAWHRRAICNSASTCGCWCSQLVKSVGVALVYCHDPATGENHELHTVLEKPEFQCPMGRF